MALICAAEPTRLTDNPTEIAAERLDRTDPSPDKSDVRNGDHVCGDIGGNVAGLRFDNGQCC